MKTLTRTVVSSFIFFLSHSALSMTVVSNTGSDNGLGIGVTAQNTSLSGPATVATPSSTFLYEDVASDSGSGDGTDVWRYGNFSFSKVFSILPGQVIQSASLQVSSGGHGLGGNPSIVVLDGVKIGNLTQGEGYAPRPASGPAPGYNALFKDTFDLSSVLTSLTDGVANITIAPGGGARDGWVLDFTSLVLNITATPPVVTDNTGEGENPDNEGPGGEVTNPVTPAAPVPVPAAFWLLLSGFVALFRFKK